MDGQRTRKDRRWERKEQRNKGQRKGEANGRMQMEGWMHGKWLDE